MLSQLLYVGVFVRVDGRFYRLSNDSTARLEYRISSFLHFSNELTRVLTLAR